MREGKADEDGRGRGGWEGVGGGGCGWVRERDLNEAIKFGPGSRVGKYLATSCFSQPLA